MRHLIFLLCFAITACVPGKKPDRKPAQIWLTTGDGSKKLEKIAEVNWTGSEPNAAVIVIGPTVRLQPVLGFGAAMTGSSAQVLTQNLTPAARSALMRELFDEKNGIGLSYLRMTIGASDFSSHDYSYCDGCDESLQNFTLKEDLSEVIPRLKEALAINPNLKIMGTPWSAPAFLKTSGSMERGKLKPGSEAVFARYLLKYVQAMQREGLPVSTLTIQNEPQHEPETYPGMLMAAEEQRDFIKNHLGPLFQQEKIETGIVVYDHNWDHPEYPLTILDDPEAAKFVHGTAFHCYGGDPANIAKVGLAHPDKLLYFTECSGGEWATNWRDNLLWNTQNILLGNLRNGCSAVLFWNLALDENHGPKNGGCDNCRGVVTVRSDGTVERNIEYYVLAHLSRFVKNGAYRIPSQEVTSSGLGNVAFKNPDGSRVVLVLNSNDSPQMAKIQEERMQPVVFELPAKSVATVVW
ncbi:MAG: hypothetical protein HY842_01770 [Bacteroidetes bacterium]|nr:hypothetical protein [Bacteroidota bacterium]